MRFSTFVTAAMFIGIGVVVGSVVSATPPRLGTSDAGSEQNAAEPIRMPRVQATAPEPLTEVDASSIAEIMDLRARRGGILAGSIFEHVDPVDGETAEDFGDALLKVAGQHTHHSGGAAVPHAYSVETQPLAPIARNREAMSQEQRLAEQFRRTGRALGRQANQYERARRHADAARLRRLADDLRAEAERLSFAVE